MGRLVFRSTRQKHFVIVELCRVAFYQRKWYGAEEEVCGLPGQTFAWFNCLQHLLYVSRLGGKKIDETLVDRERIHLFSSSFLSLSSVKSWNHLRPRLSWDISDLKWETRESGSSSAIWWCNSLMPPQKWFLMLLELCKLVLLSAKPSGKRQTNAIRSAWDGGGGWHCKVTTHRVQQNWSPSPRLKSSLPMCEPRLLCFCPSKSGFPKDWRLARHWRSILHWRNEKWQKETLQPWSNAHSFCCTFYLQYSSSAAASRTTTATTTTTTTLHSFTTAWGVQCAEWFNCMFELSPMRTHANTHRDGFHW